MWCVANAKFLGSLFSQLSKFVQVLRFLLLGKRVLVLPTVNFVTQLILGHISSNGVSLPEWLSVTALFQTCLEGMQNKNTAGCISFLQQFQP